MYKTLLIIIIYCLVIASNRFLRCQRCYHIFKVISADENNLKDVPEEQNKYKPPPIPKEVSNLKIILFCKQRHITYLKK